VAAFREADGTVRYAFGGDLLGNVWKFDLETAGAGEHDATLVAVLKDSLGNTQPITATPELTTLSGKRIILIGTGRLLDITDFGSTRTQSFYAIADGATLSNARTGLVAQVFTRGASPELTSNPFNWATNRGWYFDLPAGEQANTDPVVTYGAVVFVSNKNGSSDCSQASYLYLVDIGTGTQVVTSAFVSKLISDNATSSRVITLRVVDGKIVGITHRSDNEVFQTPLPLGQTIKPSKNAWKEIRR
jgi:type IV pilus assembly protein PilY1